VLESWLERTKPKTRTSKRVDILDSTTRSQTTLKQAGREVWRAPIAGQLSIAAGRLFIAAEDGTLHSYAMTL
jgi:hypothetical protein